MDKIALIKKFLDNNCNAEEASLAARMLQEESALLDTVLSKSEWDAVMTDQPLDHALKELIWAGVEEQTREKQVYRLWKPLVAAASILIVIGMAVLFYLSSDIHFLGVHSRNSTMLADNQKTFTNSTQQKQLLLLSDGSTVTLYPQSAITYSTDFEQHRSITLIGKAVFKVAKDTLHPFTVYAGGYSTTALGTQFMVDHTAARINVQLYEGRVVVKAIKEHSNLAHTYLSPGEQCFIDSKADLIRVASIDRSQGYFELETTSSSRKLALSPEVLKFYKMPLKDVFRVLESNFSKNITYQDTDVSGKYFTGSFSNEEPLPEILKVIAGVNGLDVVYRPGNEQVSINKKEDGESPLMGSDLGYGTTDSEEGNSQGPVTTLEGSRQYRKAPLSTVLRELQQSHGVLIDFKTKDLYNKYFTGTISDEDDVANILNLIGKMNGLHISTDSIGFKVRRQ